jgi:hypothetical protein
MAEPTPRPDRLLAIIELQNVIAAAGMNADEVMRIVADRAGSLTAGSGGVVGLVEGDDVVCRAAAAGAKHMLGLRLSPSTAAGRCAPMMRCMYRCSTASTRSASSVRPPHKAPSSATKTSRP